MDWMLTDKEIADALSANEAALKQPQIYLASNGTEYRTTGALRVIAIAQSRKDAEYLASHIKSPNWVGYWEQFLRATGVDKEG